MSVVRSCSVQELFVSSAHFSRPGSAVALLRPSPCFAMPKPNRPSADDEETKWQRKTAHNLHWYKVRSKELDDEERGWQAAQGQAASSGTTSEPAAASSSWSPPPPPFSKGVQPPKELAQTPAEEQARPRLGGTLALSFVPQRHITIVWSSCGGA